MKKQWIVSFAFVLGLAQPSFANKLMLPSFLRVPHINLAGSSNLQYYGGPVISHAKIYAVYWGSNVEPSVRNGAGAFYKSLVTSDHMDWLNEYATNINAVDGRKGTGQSIGRGSYGGEYVITPINTKTSLDDQEIRKEIEAQVAAHALPVPDADSLYMIHFPAGVSITIEGSASCAQFCAYHEGFQSAQYGSVFYGVIPDLGSGACSFGCGMGASQFESTTVAASHEVTEAVTDAFPTAGSNPSYPQAWNTSDGNEIGDLCASTSATLNSSSGRYSIQGEYDNSTSSCKTGSYTAP
jgi:hypothetical protein